MSTSDIEQAKEYALRLAKSLGKKHYPENTVWRPADDLIGLLMQIVSGCPVVMRRVGKAVAGRLLDGREHSEWPIQRGPQ